MVRSGFIQAAACALVTVALAKPAAAEEDQGRPIKLLVGSTAAWNSNVFLVPNNVESDFYVAPYVGLRIDKPYAQQRFQLDVTGTFYRYKNLSFLNDNSFTYRGAWLWHLSPRVSGTISADRKQDVNDFYDFHNRQSFVTTTENRYFSIDGWISGGWHLLMGTFDYETKYSQIFQPQVSSRLLGIDPGVKYVAASGSSITAVTRLSKGDYPNQPLDPVNLIDNDYIQRESGLESTWNLGPKSTVNGRLTWFEHRGEHFSQRNFSGPTYQLNYDWASLSGKLRLNLNAKRELGVYTTDLSSYSLTNTQSFTPIWQATDKIAVRMHLERSTRSFRGPVVVPAFPLRGDTYLAGLLAVDWSPLRNVTLSASAQRNHRSSNIFANEFNETVGGLSASVKF
jgi:exopolysaccharide biosynthesis operon protein EpsL